MKKIILIILIIVCSNYLFGEDLSLEGCLEKGLKNNLELKDYLLQQKSSELNIDDAINSFFNIGLEGGISGQVSEKSQEYISVNNSKYGVANASLKLRGSLSLALWDNYKYSKLEFENSKLSVKNYENILSYYITTAFYQALLQQEELKVKTKKVEYSKIQYEEAKLRYDLGSLTKSELLQSEVSLSEAKLDILRAKTDLNKAKQKLLTYMNSKMDYQNLNLISENEELIIKNFDLYSLIAEAKKSRIDYKLKANSLKLSKLSKAMAFDTFFPALVASFGANYNYYKYDQEFDIRDDNYTVIGHYDSYYTHGFNLSLGLSWDLSYNEFNKIDKRSVEIKRAQNRLGSKELEIENEVKNAYLEIKNEEERLKSIDKHIKLAKENLDLASKMFNLGNQTMTAQIKAKNDYIEALYQQIYAKYNYKIAIANLNKVIGK